jgi:hypothetical protein
MLDISPHLDAFRPANFFFFFFLVGQNAAVSRAPVGGYGFISPRGWAKWNDE